MTTNLNVPTVNGTIDMVQFQKQLDDAVNKNKVTTPTFNYQTGVNLDGLDLSNSTDNVKTTEAEVSFWDAILDFFGLGKNKTPEAPKPEANPEVKPGTPEAPKPEANPEVKPGTTEKTPETKSTDKTKEAAKTDETTNTEGAEKPETKQSKIDEILAWVRADKAAEKKKEIQRILDGGKPNYNDKGEIVTERGQVIGRIINEDEIMIDGKKYNISELRKPKLPLERLQPEYQKMLMKSEYLKEDDKNPILR